LETQQSHLTHRARPRPPGRARERCVRAVVVVVFRFYSRHRLSHSCIRIVEEPPRIPKDEGATPDDPRALCANRLLVLTHQNSRL
jgi:hypothetical protein